MKFSIPEISWHNRDPVLSVDFQPKREENGPLRLASGGTDSHVIIWYITITETGSVNTDVAADLTRHQKAVNVVRWSPNGELLASGDDEAIIFVWQQKTDKETMMVTEQGEDQYKESWVIYKALRGHMEDVLDLSWSADSLHLASGSVDNKLIVWDVARSRYSSINTDHKGFVQGVSWDPQGSLIVSASSDRVFRSLDISSKKVLSRSSKCVLPFPKDHALHDVKVRLYHDDTLQTYYRRLHFSPDGLLVAVPAGKIEPEQGKPDVKPINAVYIYTRYSLKAPVCVLPCGEPALAVRWSPIGYQPPPTSTASKKPDSGTVGSDTTTKPVTRAVGPSRVLAVATRRALLIYHTQQKAPIALLSGIHYTRLTDVSWSGCGRLLVASSTDGFCSFVSFGEQDLGEPYQPPDTVPMEVENEDVKTNDSPKPINTLDSIIKFKAPSKSPKNQKIIEPKTPVKMDVLEDMAMPSWSDNSSNDIIKPNKLKSNDKLTTVIEIEDSEDMKLVYDETETKLVDSPKQESPKIEKKESPKIVKKESPKSTFLKQAKVTDIIEPVAVKAVPSPKAPRRVNLVTLSSPKNPKKL